MLGFIWPIQLSTFFLNLINFFFNPSIKPILLRAFFFQHTMVGSRRWKIVNVYSKLLLLAHFHHCFFKQRFKLASLQDWGKGFLSQDSIKYCIEFSFSLFVKKPSVFGFGLFFAEFNVLFFQFEPCFIGFLNDFPEKLADEIFFLRRETCHKIALLNFVMDGHFVVPDFGNDFVQGIDFLFESRVVVFF